MFDLMSGPIDCVNKIEVTPTALPLAPAATELEFRGPLCESGWSVSLKEKIDAQFSTVPMADSVERTFPICFGAGPEEKLLLLGAFPRAEVEPKESPKKREKRQ